MSNSNHYSTKPGSASNSGHGSRDRNYYGSRSGSGSGSAASNGTNNNNNNNNTISANTSNTGSSNRRYPGGSGSISYSNEALANGYSRRNNDSSSVNRDYYGTYRSSTSSNPPNRDYDRTSDRIDRSDRDRVKGSTYSPSSPSPGSGGSSTYKGSAAPGISSSSLSSSSSSIPNSFRKRSNYDKYDSYPPKYRSSNPNVSAASSSVKPSSMRPKDKYKDFSRTSSYSTASSKPSSSRINYDGPSSPSFVPPSNSLNSSRRSSNSSVSSSSYLDETRRKSSLDDDKSRPASSKIQPNTNYDDRRFGSSGSNSSSSSFIPNHQRRSSGGRPSIEHKRSTSSSTSNKFTDHYTSADRKSTTPSSSFKPEERPRSKDYEYKRASHGNREREDTRRSTYSTDDHNRKLELEKRRQKPHSTSKPSYKKASPQPESYESRVSHIFDDDDPHDVDNDFNGKYRKDDPLSEERISRRGSDTSKYSKNVSPDFSGKPRDTSKSPSTSGFSDDKSSYISKTEKTNDDLSKRQKSVETEVKSKNFQETDSTKHKENTTTTKNEQERSPKPLPIKDAASINHENHDKNEEDHERNEVPPSMSSIRPTKESSYKPKDENFKSHGKLNDQISDSSQIKGKDIHDSKKRDHRNIAAQETLGNRSKEPENSDRKDETQLRELDNKRPEGSDGDVSKPNKTDEKAQSHEIVGAEHTSASSRENAFKPPAQKQKTSFADYLKTAKIRASDSKPHKDVSEDNKPQKSSAEDVKLSKEHPDEKKSDSHTSDNEPGKKSVQTSLPSDTEKGADISDNDNKTDVVVQSIKTDSKEPSTIRPDIQSDNAKIFKKPSNQSLDNVPELDYQNSPEKHPSSDESKLSKAENVAAEEAASRNTDMSKVESVNMESTRLAADVDKLEPDSASSIGGDNKSAVTSAADSTLTDISNGKASIADSFFKKLPRKSPSVPVSDDEDDDFQQGKSESENISEAETVITDSPPRIRQGRKLIRKRDYDELEQPLKRKRSRKVISSDEQESDDESTITKQRSRDSDITESKEKQSDDGAKPFKNTSNKPTNDLKEETVKKSTAVAKPKGTYKIKRDSSGRSLLQRACKKGDLADVKRYISIGADANESDFGGFTCLHEAALAGHTEVVKYLISHGADVNRQAKEAGDSETPLMDAAENQHADTVKVLLENGADPQIYNSDGYTALTKMYHLHTDEEGYEEIIELLEKSLGANKGASSNKSGIPLVPSRIVEDPYEDYFINLLKKKNISSTIYKYVAQGMKEAAASDFLSHNFTLQSRPDILNLAARHGHVELVDILLGLNPGNYDINQGNKVGLSPLLCSVGLGNYEVVKFLLSRGADPKKQRSKDGLNSLEIAKYSAHYDPREVELLQSYFKSHESNGEPENIGTEQESVKDTQIRPQSGDNRKTESDSPQSESETEAGATKPAPISAIKKFGRVGDDDKKRVKDNAVDDASGSEVTSSRATRSDSEDLPRADISRDVSKDNETPKESLLEKKRKNAPTLVDATSSKKLKKIESRENDPRATGKHTRTGKEETPEPAEEPKFTKTAESSPGPHNESQVSSHRPSLDMSHSPEKEHSKKPVTHSPSPAPLTKAQEEQKAKIAEEARMWQEKAEAKKRARKEFFIKAEKEKERKRKEEEEKRLEEQRKLEILEREKKLKEAQEAAELNRQLESKRGMLRTQKCIEHYPIGLRTIKFNTKRTREELVRFTPLYVFSIDDVPYVIDLQIALITSLPVAELEKKVKPSSKLELTFEDKSKTWTLFYPMIGVDPLNPYLNLQNDGHPRFKNLLLNFVKLSEVRSLLDTEYPEASHLIWADGLITPVDLQSLLVFEKKRPIRVEHMDNANDVVIDIEQVKQNHFVPPKLRSRHDALKTIRRSNTPLW